MKNRILNFSLIFGLISIGIFSHLQAADEKNKSFMGEANTDNTDEADPLGLNAATREHLFSEGVVSNEDLHAIPTLTANH